MSATYSATCSTFPGFRRESEAARRDDNGGPCLRVEREVATGQATTSPLPDVMSRGLLRLCDAFSHNCTRCGVVWVQLVLAVRLVAPAGDPDTGKVKDVVMHYSPA